ncbi:MAG: calycin-like domain-containing protein [Bacteroidales bacterium]|nr:calycin-like domain-containing protein [Bacteroidales bacterium]
MRKLSTMFCAALMSLSAMATDYSGTLTVSVNGEEGAQPATISVVENAGKYNLSVNNFILVSGETTLPVGNIVVENVTGAVNEGLTTLYVDKNIQIQPGNADGVAAEEWIGPMLGNVPVKMTSRFNADGFLAVDIDIDMQAVLGQTIKVQFENVGDHFQMPNSDFETWSTANNAPKHWHGFESVKGGLASTAKSNTKLQASNRIRPGSTGSKSAVATCSSVMGIIANGTLTNGILNAGSPIATNAANHSETDLSSDAKDVNGDPFATPIYAKPDAVKFWAKFSQAKTVADFPYATFNAVLTDGTYYQDPEDKAYSNKVAVASNVPEKMGVGDWREVVRSFDYASYASNNVEAKAILMTFSTNATPGKGSVETTGSFFNQKVVAADSLFIDDLELVYLAGIKSIAFKGNALDLATIQNTGIQLVEGESAAASDFVVEKEGVDSKVTTLVEAAAEGYVAVITAVSADLKTTETYVINIKTPSAPVLKGDVDQNGVVDVTDVTVLINMILNSEAEASSVADVDENGVVDVTDVTTLISLILG